MLGTRALAYSGLMLDRLMMSGGIIVLLLVENIGMRYKMEQWESEGGAVKRANCPHGVEYGRGGLGRMNGGKPVVWNGGVAFCECCASHYGYIDSGGGFYNDKTNQWNSINVHIEPKDRCQDCRK